jgi:hypothetical protein
MATKEETMNVEKIEIQFNPQTGQMLVGAQMDNQDQKDRTVRMLLSAIKIVVDFKPSVIKPASSIPETNGNGKIPLKVTH